MFVFVDFLCQRQTNDDDGSMPCTEKSSALQSTAGFAVLTSLQSALTGLDKLFDFVKVVVPPVRFVFATISCSYNK